MQKLFISWRITYGNILWTRLKTRSRFNDPFKSLRPHRIRAGFHDVYASSDMIFKDICTHTCKWSGSRDFGRESRACFRKHTTAPPPSAAYNMRHYVMHVCAPVCTRTQVCIHCPPSIEPSTSIHRHEAVEHVLHTGKIKCKYRSTPLPRIWPKFIRRRKFTGENSTNKQACWKLSMSRIRPAL